MKKTIYIFKPKRNLPIFSGLAAFILIFAIIGVHLLSSSHAATPPNCTDPSANQQTDYGYTYGTVNAGFPTLCNSGYQDGFSETSSPTMTQVGPFEITRSGSNYVMAGTYNNASDPCPNGAVCSGDMFTLTQSNGTFQNYQVYGDWHAPNGGLVDYAQPVAFDGSDQYIYVNASNVTLKNIDLECDSTCAADTEPTATVTLSTSSTNYTIQAGLQLPVGTSVTASPSNALPSTETVSSYNPSTGALVLSQDPTASGSAILTFHNGASSGKNTAIDDSISGSGSMTVEDSTFNGPYWFGIRTSPNATILRDQFTEFSDAFLHLSDSDNITGNYVSETASEGCPSPDPLGICNAHKDGIQGIGGVSNVTIDNNTLLMATATLDGTTSSLFIVNQEGPNNSPGPVIVNDNFFGGGSDQVYLGDGNTTVNPSACPTSNNPPGCDDLGVTFENNVFIKGDGAYGAAAEYYPVYDGAVWYPAPGITICGNTFSDGSAIPLTGSQKVGSGPGANPVQQSLPVNPRCSGSSTPPSVTVSSPVSNSEVYGNAFTVDTTPVANDGGSIASSQLLINGTSGQNLTTAPYNFTLNTLGYRDGSYTMTINSTDDQGNSGSASLTVYVSNGDLNFDGNVNISDLAIMAANWGKTGQTYAEGSINGSGTVNIQDLAILASNWGATGL